MTSSDHPGFMHRRRRRPSPVALVAAGLLAGGLIWLARGYDALALEASVFRTAPICQAGAPDTGDCREVVAANVVDRQVSGPSQWQTQWIRLQVTGEGDETVRVRRGFQALVPGQPATLVRWRGRIAEIRQRNGTAWTDHSPDWQSEDRIWGIGVVAVALVVSLLMVGLTWWAA